MAIDYTWPAPGAVGWGTSVDNNLESMEARLNTIEAALANGTGSGTGGGTGPQGPPGPAGPTGQTGAPGPMSLRFCVGGTWQARPPGTSASPILNISIGQANVHTPPNAVEGDVWLY